MRLAEFHRVVSPVYYGTLGVEKTLSAADEETFYSKYHKEVLLEESYKNALEVILWQMNRHQVQGVLLRGVEIRSMYPKRGIRLASSFLYRQRIWEKFIIS